MCPVLLTGTRQFTSLPVCPGHQSSSASEKGCNHQKLLVKSRVSSQPVPPPHSLPRSQLLECRSAHGKRGWLEFPPSETIAERPVSLTSPKRPCPNGTDNRSPLNLSLVVCQFAQSLQSFKSSDFQIACQSGLGATVFCRPPGHAGVASYPQTQSDRAAYAVIFRFSLPAVAKSWRPTNGSPFPSPSARQLSTTKIPVPRRIQLLGGSVSTSTKLPHRIDPSIWAGAQFPPTRLAGPRQHCTSSKTVVILDHQ